MFRCQKIVLFTAATANSKAVVQACVRLAQSGVIRQLLSSGAVEWERLHSVVTRSQPANCGVG